MTEWWHYLVALLAPAFLVNTIPHLVAGVQGRRFPTAFVGGPPNLDTPERNIIWAGINFVIGSLLLWLLSPSLGNPAIIIEMIAIVWLAAFGLAKVFSRLP